jgi:hypothetical protein
MISRFHVKLVCEKQGILWRVPFYVKSTTSCEPIRICYCYALSSPFTPGPGIARVLTHANAKARKSNNMPLYLNYEAGQF